MPRRIMSSLVPTKVRYGIMVSGIALSLVLILSLIACAGPTATLAPELTQTPALIPIPQPLASAAFQVSELAINPTEVESGGKVTITAKLVNSGDTEGTYTAKLFINNSATIEREVTLSAGATQNLSFVDYEEVPGIYLVTLGERTEQFIVVEPGESTESNNQEIITPTSTLAPSFDGVDVVTGETISLTQFKDSIVLLNFVNYGCSASLNKTVSAQLLVIKELREQRDDFIPLSVFCGCCPPYVLRDFAMENGLSWPWILDTENSIVPLYLDYLREYGYPTLIFIDTEQHIRYATGPMSLSMLSNEIDETSQY